jgi:hypothetical protein
MRRCILPGGVAKAQKYLDITALWAPCQAGASTPKNVNLFLCEPEG